MFYKKKEKKREIKILELVSPIFLKTLNCILFKDPTRRNGSSRESQLGRPFSCIYYFRRHTGRSSLRSRNTFIIIFLPLEWKRKIKNDEREEESSERRNRRLQSHSIQKLYGIFKKSIICNSNFEQQQQQRQRSCPLILKWS